MMRCDRRLFVLVTRDLAPERLLEVLDPGLVSVGVLSICEGSLVRGVQATGVDRQLRFGFPPAASMT
jgi:hypothetical protein